MNQKRFYFDTSIWIDLFENRNIKGDLVEMLITKIINENGLIFYSRLILEELNAFGYSRSDISEKFVPLRPILKYIDSENLEIRKANDISEKRRIPKGDVLHAFLARRGRCIIITHDRHFKKLKDIAIAAGPGQFIN